VAAPRTFEPPVNGRGELSEPLCSIDVPGLFVRRRVAPPSMFFNSHD
jgi:hypothetical protein